MATLLSLPNETLFQIIEESAPDGIESLAFASKLCYKLAKPVLRQRKQDLKNYSTLHLNNEVITLYHHMNADEMDELKLNPLGFLQALLERPRLARYPKTVVLSGWFVKDPGGTQHVPQDLVEGLSALALQEAEASTNNYSATWVQWLLCYWHCSSTHEELKSFTL
ncbi:hypothetical protein OEA41_009600 [Lepraria neglecta]|uniref:F-box domain-containing protein n=1 Tax=Lepraria neglecta TaxID=209136 RepID=A0AAE0DHX1_9LECA|nr:hypothetical protein OEA41_009600 [Lepraria neglecta]